MRAVTKQRIKSAAKLLAGLFGWKALLYGTIVVMIAMKFKGTVTPILMDDSSRIQEQVMKHDLNSGRGGF